MNKPSEKKPIIPEMNIPDAADYQPSRSAFIKFATQAYVFIRTKPRIMAGSFAVLGLTVACVAVAYKGKITTLPPIEVNSIDVAANITPQILQSNKQFDDTIENINTDELRTSIKPLELQDEPNTTVVKDTPLIGEPRAETSNSLTVELKDNHSTLNGSTESVSIVKKDDVAPANLPESGSNNTAPLVFSERFGETSSPMTEAEAQEALKAGLSKIGSLEQSIDNLKSFPFDLVIKPENVEPKYALLKIAEGSDATSGFWREIEEPNEVSGKGKKKANNKREEHFLVLQAIDEGTGKPISVDVKDMDSGETKKENSWAVLIPEKQFMEFAQSKKDDGTFAKPVLGKLNLKTGEINWEIDTDGRALINWKDFAE